MASKSTGALRLTLVACSALTSPAVASAQVEAAQNVPEPVVAASTTDIIVTANRRSQSLQDVPMTVDVASGEQLQKLNLLDVKDVAQLSPGLQLTNTNGRNNTATLRGVTFDPDQGTSPSVDVYLNEVPTSAQTVFAAVYDIEQIEVLRGPQGALRGRTAPAGAITIRTRRPDLEGVDGYYQATGTDRDAYNVQGALSFPIIEGTLALRAAVLVDGNRINQVRNVNSGGRSRSRTESARLSLRWEPDPAVRLNLSYQYLTYDNRVVQQVVGQGNAPALGSPDRSGPPASVADYIGVSEGDRRFINEGHFLNGSAEWDLGPATLTVIGGYQFSKLTQAYDQDVGNSIPGYINISRVVAPYKVRTGEVRLSSNNDGMWNWTVSAFYNQDTGLTTQDQNADTFFGRFPAALGLYLPITVGIDVPRYERTMSVAASSRFVFTPDLTLEVGARYTDQRSEQFAYSTVSSPGFPGVPGFPIPARPPIAPNTSALVPANIAVGKGQALTGGATLMYEISPGVTTYAAYGRSFRLGSAGVGVPQNLSVDLIRSGDEHSDAVEIGFKTSLLDRRITANVSAFYQKYDGYIVRLPSIYYDFGLRNALGQAVGAPDGVVDGVFPSGFNYNGDATVKGMEATINARATPNWDLMVGASYAKGRFDGASLPCNDFNGDGSPDTTGTPRITGRGNVSYCEVDGRLAELPDFNLTANTELRFPMGDVAPYISALVTYRPGFSYWRTNYRYQAQTSINLYVGIRPVSGSWELKGFVKNLLNQKRVLSIAGPATVPTASPSMVYDSGYTLISSTIPRELGLTAQLNF